jgi:Peptidase family M28/PA domain
MKGLNQAFLALALATIVSVTAMADTSAEERAMLQRLDVARTLTLMRQLSEDIVTNRSGAGAGTAVAGSADEKRLADFIEQRMTSLGLTVHQERFPVRHYEYGEVKLTVGGKAIPAVSLHAAGGTWGTRDGVSYTRGNGDTDHHQVRGMLVDAGDGFAADYARAGDVNGKIVLVRRGGGWPTYQFIEAARRGALALLMYDYPGGRDDTLKQDSMWYHEQLPTVSIRRVDAKAFQQNLARGAVEVTLENRIDVDDGFSENVIGVIRGTESPDEWITVSAHHDRWFKAAIDDCSGVASMLELARLFTGGGYSPRRSLMFISFGAEEAGVEATESDWLAGSQAFITQHPEVTRRLALGVNIDVTGWSGEKGALLTTPDNVAFERTVLTDLGLADRVTVRPVLSSTTDAWNLGAVGGGAASLMTWINETGGGVFGGASSYAAIYHTDVDVFDAKLVPNLETDLRIEALGVVRADRAVALPIQFTGIASWIEDALKADEPKAPGVSFAGAQAALATFTAAAMRVERARATIRSANQAGPVNLWLMRTRKDLLPWVTGRGAGGVRTTAYANQVQTLALARATAERGDGPATLTAIGRMLGPGARVSRETFHDQRLYSYTSGDWSSLFEQRPKPIGPALYDVYQRLQAGGSPGAEVASLNALESEARARLADALFLVAGKLNQATRALAETPLP